MSDLIEYAKTLSCKEDRRALILDLEEGIKKQIVEGVPPAEDNLHEVFCNGIYSREITLEKGTLAVGEIHKQDHVNILSKGHVVVFTDDGIQEIVAPHRWLGTAGVKRATFVIEDAVWTTFHATQHTTSDDVRNDFVAKTYDDVSVLEGTYGVGSDSDSSNNTNKHSSDCKPTEEGC